MKDLNDEYLHYKMDAQIKLAEHELNIINSKGRITLINV